MAVTRGSKGITQPRTPFTIEATPASTKTKTKSKTTTTKAPKVKANTSKPRAKATASGRVEKKKAPAKKAGVKDKVKGVVEKGKGVVEGKPGKKVCVFLFGVVGGAVGMCGWGGEECLF